MIEDIISLIRNIFVGRHSELRYLRGLWDLACKDEEHLIYVFLNAPGVGKTTLINHFGELLESEGKGLYIRFSCSSNYDSPHSLNENLLIKIQESIHTKEDIIESYFETIENESKKKLFRDNYPIVIDKINEGFNKKIISINDIIIIIKRLSNIIPIFFAADDIQEFQKLAFTQTGSKEEETALHYFTRILKDLLNSKVLLVLSGTRYHILSQIGSKIGSPIRQKVRPIIIRNFEGNEVNAYVDYVRDLIKNAKLSKNTEFLPTYLENYKRFLYAFSGGHPRTIENITEFFLNNIPYLLNHTKYLKYEEFIDFFLPKIAEFFNNSLLSSDHKKLLSELTVSEEFSEVKRWILNKGTNGQLLGERPKFIDDNQVDDEIKRIIYQIMNIGIIVQNGNYNYHLTSYFHFLEFLKVYQEPYETFLKQVLHNKFFTLMCGRHSGFGYTFENVFAATLILYGSKEQDIQIPIKSAQLRSLDEIKGKIDWAEILLEKNIIYQTPDARAIDIIILQGEELLLIQITTANPPDLSKFEALKEEINALLKIKLRIEGIKRIQGWGVSLFDIKKELSAYEDIIIIAGDQLIRIIGEDLYRRLRDIKQHL